MRSESERLKGILQSKESQITDMTEEKAKLLATTEVLEEKLRNSSQAVTELQQKCDLMSEQLDALKVEKGALEKEKDVSVLQNTQEKMHLENSAKKVQELQEKLDKEESNKKELLQVADEMEGLLKEQKAHAEKKSRELAEVEKMLKLGEAREEKLTFAYEDLRGKLEKLEKEFKQKCKELTQAKEELKQAQERSEGLKEEYEAELDQVKFELRDSNSDCALLKGENEQLKRGSTGGNDQSAWNKEKKKLLHQLEESKIRFNQAKSSQERLEKELNQAKLKVISLESKGNSAEAEEIKCLQTRLSELNQELQKWKGIANNKEKANSGRKELSAKADEIKRLQSRISELNQEVLKWKAVANNKKTDVSSNKDAEIKRLQEKLSELQEELEKSRALADEKRKAADKTLATNLKLVSKIEKLTRGKESPQNNPTDESSPKECARDERATPSPAGPLRPRVSVKQAALNPGVFSPLAKSMASLDIKSLNTAATVTAENRSEASSSITQVTTAAAVSAQPVAVRTSERRPSRGERDAVASAVPQIEKEKGSSHGIMSVATRRGIPKPFESMDSKKRPGELGMFGSVSFKRQKSQIRVKNTDHICCRHRIQDK